MELISANPSSCGSTIMLEDEGSAPKGRAMLQAPSRFVVIFDRTDAEAWRPALYAFSIGYEVIRIGKTESTPKNRMMEWERLVSRAVSGTFQKGGTNPWEAFEWRRRLIEHRRGAVLLARRGSKGEVRTAERGLIRRYKSDPFATMVQSLASGPQKVVACVMLLWQSPIGGASMRQPF
jgi:hypothetical protein